MITRNGWPNIHFFFRPIAIVASQRHLFFLRPGNRILPVRPVKWQAGYLIDLPRVETPQIDAKTIRMRSRDIKRLDAALAAEQMAGGPGIKAVFGERLFPAEQGEILGLDDQVLITGQRAYRAIAIEDFEFRRRPDDKTDGATMATTAIFNLFGRIDQDRSQFALTPPAVLPRLPSRAACCPA